MDEHSFLKNRQEREDARVARQNAEASEDTVARQEFVKEVDRLKKQVEAATALGKEHAGNDEIKLAQLEDATNYYRLLQAHIQRGADLLNLPPHEIKSANTTLAACLAGIDDVRNAAKPKKKFTFSKRTNVTVTKVTTKDGEHNTAAATCGSAAASMMATDPALTFADKADTTVFVTHGKAAFIRRCKNCTILVLPIAGSCFLSDCEGCTVYAACHQMRIKSCNDTAVYVWCSSIPVIENSRNMSFGPYSAWTGLLKTRDAKEIVPEDALQAHNTLPTTEFTTHDDWILNVGRITDLDHARKSFMKIDDFDWLKQQQSPYWRVIPEEEVRVCEEVFVAAGGVSA